MRFILLFFNEFIKISDHMETTFKNDTAIMKTIASQERSIKHCHLVARLTGLYSQLS